MIDKANWVGSGALAALGALATIVFAACFAYAMVELGRRWRVASVLLVAAAAGAATTTVGMWLVTSLSAIVVVVQAVAYVGFAVRSMLMDLLRSASSESRGPGEAMASAPHVAVVIPARDEAAVIEDTLRALGRLRYPRGQLEVVVLDDGSRDGTGELASRIIEQMSLPGRVVRTEASRGKARRINALLPQLESEFVLVLDADHWIEPELLEGMLVHFQAAPDVACVQVASAVRNGGAGLLARALEMEYLFRCRGIYPGKAMGIFVGSGGLFRRSDLLAVGGFDAAMLTEDVEISYRLYEHGRRVVYDDRFHTTDLAPSDVKSFFSQRRRWMRGTCRRGR